MRPEKWQSHRFSVTLPRGWYSLAGPFNGAAPIRHPIVLEYQTTSILLPTQRQNQAGAAIRRFSPPPFAGHSASLKFAAPRSPPEPRGRMGTGRYSGTSSRHDRTTLKCEIGNNYHALQREFALFRLLIQFAQCSGHRVCSTNSMCGMLHATDFANCSCLREGLRGTVGRPGSARKIFEKCLAHKSEMAACGHACAGQFRLR